MEAFRGANLVGMPVWPPDVGLSPCLAKKKITIIFKIIYLFYVNYVKQKTQYKINLLKNA